MPCYAPTFGQLTEPQRREYWAALALRHTPGLGGRSHGRLVAHFGSAYDAVQSAPYWEGTGIALQKAQFVSHGRWRESAREEWESAKASQDGIILWTDELYPSLLKTIIDPPLLLYTRGDVALLQNPSLGIVGSRLSSREGRCTAAKVASELSAAGVTIVSGMARGIDKEAHLAAISHVGSTIGILGTGVDVRYPRENSRLFYQMEERGLLLSEFALGTRPDARHFPIRNRLISALSMGVLVVEAAARSGSLITARLALEHGREVYAIPAPASLQSARGCNDLLSDGAHAVRNADDILQDLAPQLYAALSQKKKSLVEAYPLIDTLPPTAQESRKADKHDGHVVEVIPSVATLASKNNKKTASCTKAPKKTKAQRKVAPLASPLHESGEKMPSATSTADTLLALLQAHEELHVDVICRETGLPINSVSAELLLLEVDGYVRRLPGMRYMLVRL